MYTNESYLIVSVNVVICAGARTDIQDDVGKTLLQIAEEYLADESDPKQRQQLQEVQESKHTPHFNNISQSL